MPSNQIGSFNVFISHGRLPWSTLESDLEKRGIELINWPAEVPRNRGNKGINDLSVAQADALYRAIMHPDKENRLGLRYLLPFTGILCLHCHCHLNDICTVTHTTEVTGEQESRP